MLKIKAFKLLGINFADSYLSDNNTFYNFFQKVGKEEAREFIIWYLSKPYNRSNKYTFLYVNEIMVRGLLDSDEVDEILISSTYMDTIPVPVLTSMILEYACPLEFLPKFIQFISAKIVNYDNKEFLRTILESGRVNFMVKDACIERTIKVSSIDEAIESLRCYNYESKIQVDKRVMDSDKYSLDDIKKFCVAGDNSTTNIVEWFGILLEKSDSDYKKNETINALIEVAEAVSSKVSETNKLIDVRNGHVIEGYEYFAREISKSPKYTQDIKNKIAEKILVTGNTLFMLPWISYVESNKTCDMIDYLVNFSVDMAVRVLAFVPTNLLVYAVRKVTDKGPDYTTKVMDTVLGQISSCPIDTIDSILVNVCESYPKFKISRENALLLIKAGSIYTTSLLHSHSFNSEERLDILNTYNENGRGDLVAIYSSYLISGDTTKIVHRTSVDVDLSTLRRKPKSKDVK